MRVLTTLAALAAFAFAQTAAAATVTLAPVSFSPEFQELLEDDLGTREGHYLQQRVEAAVTRALQRAGAQVGPGGDLTVEIAIVSAEPNRPTLQQLSDRPGLDMIRSVSVGGAELRATIRRANGEEIAQVQHRYYSPSLAYVGFPAGQWTDAHRAITRFANKVALAYQNQG
ncbi:MAG: DUF3313 family protein [Hyphomonadaceae bacterium]